MIFSILLKSCFLLEQKSRIAGKRMIIGTGIDIVDIDRIKKIIKKWDLHFLNKVYTLDEKYYCEQKKDSCFQSFAGYFAAKEAWVKAIGTGMKNIKWKEIEIKKDPLGRPFIKLYGLAMATAISRKISNTHLTISHTKQLAIAQVVIESQIL